MSVNLQRMIDGYMECADWANCGPDNETDGIDWSDELNARMATDCEAFIAACGEPLLDALAELAPEYSDQRFGHDFWLTRNGHGVGYWDRKELEPELGMSSVALGELDANQTIGDRLSEIAKAAGSFDLYVGDDGKVYGS